MSCTLTPTATLYDTVTTFAPSTSYSQSAADAKMTTVVQQSCVASGTISNSSIGCVSSTQVTQVYTVAGGGQAVQVPIVVTIPVTETQPTQTLFAPCTSGGGSAESPASQPPAQPSIYTLTTSILVQSTPPPSTIVEESSTTLADGSVVQTVVTMITTPPPTPIYVPTSIANPTLQSNSPQSGTNVTAIVGGVLGGFFGLIAIVGSLWWLCRRRRSWDDIFEKEDLHNNDAWAPTVPVRRERDGHRLDSSTQPRPYQYGLVGHVIPPAAAGEPLRTSHHSSASEHSGTHSRNTSLSATPLLQTTRNGYSRPSTAGSILTVQTHPGQRGPGPVSSTEMGPRSLSMVSHSSSIGPLVPLSTWIPNMNELAVLEPLNRSGSPVSSSDRRVLQIVNETPSSPTDTVILAARQTPSGPSSNVIMHTDGGRVLEDSLTDLDTAPPAYSR